MTEPGERREELALAKRSDTNTLTGYRSAAQRDEQSISVIQTNVRPSKQS